MKLQNIPIDKIDLISSFNVRSDFGEEQSKDLEESIKSTDGNIQPLLVCQKQDRYELISGERRFKALRRLNFKEASCIVYDQLTDLQKTQLMYNENLGRKNLSWKEEVKAIKKIKELGLDIRLETITKQKKVGKQEAWNLLTALDAVEEFPDLINEKTRSLCLDKYRALKKLEREKIDSIKERKITIKEALISKNIKINPQTMVIEELKDEINHYKEKFSNIYTLIKQLDKVERLNNGVWLSDEIKQLIEAARSCETFGMLDSNDEECNACHKTSPNVYAKCEFYNEEFEVKK